MEISPMHTRWFAAVDFVPVKKPIDSSDVYRAIRDSQLVGMSGYSREIHYYVQSHIQMNEYRDRVILPSATKEYGRYIGTCIKILDMSGLKLSALNQIKVVRPLLQERTRKKVQVLSGSGRDVLLKIMDYESLPHFCRREGSGSGSFRHSGNGSVSDCFSLDHPFHQQLYNYVKEQAALMDSVALVEHGSVHVDVPEPDPEDIKIAQTIESEFQRIGDQNGLSQSFHELKITGIERSGCRRTTTVYSLKGHPLRSCIIKLALQRCWVGSFLPPPPSIFYLWWI
ncbi:UNVERIFIED_CONTAM: hypothetical protein Sangu_0930900 [Sesamum angustifolium]|uniref:Uncharacterized protein n=1 Tax=Sesamum angustifolium TaxID=2727405 RepID=A0AAW2PFE3_9LAMI